MEQIKTAIPLEPLEVKSCCATFYQNDLVKILLGESFHPGGVALTKHLGEVLRLGPDDRVLDVASGRGASAIQLAQSFGCQVVGVDLGVSNLKAAREAAEKAGVSHLVSFEEGDAERLPFGEGLFDAVISECAFCTFPDKPTAAAEMYRILKPGGRMGLTDMTVNVEELPEDLNGLLSWVACIADARPAAVYRQILEKSGFRDFVEQDQSAALVALAEQVRGKLVAADMIVKIKKLDLNGLNLDEGKRMAKRAAEVIRQGQAGYCLLAAVKPI